MANFDFSFGQVKSNGERDNGGGKWTAQRLSMGSYRVSFTERFNDRPAITVTTVRPDDTPLVATIEDDTSANRREFVEIRIANLDSQPRDSAFQFIAIADED